jgi:hypothetical protein
MACMSATNALAARASAVRTNKRCVPTDKPHPGKLVFPREHRDDTRASVPNGVFRRARTRLPRSRATRVPTRRLSRDERQDLARAQRPPGASNRRPRDAARALRRIAPGVRFAVPRGRVFARFPGATPPVFPASSGPRADPNRPHSPLIVRSATVKCSAAKPAIVEKVEKVGKAALSGLAASAILASVRPANNNDIWTRVRSRRLSLAPARGFPRTRALAFARAHLARARRSHPRAGPHPRPVARDAASLVRGDARVSANATSPGPGTAGTAAARR